MAQLLTLRLTRKDSSCPWGFRLQGGKDFGTPLLVQKVNEGSLAEKAGLQVGDTLLRVNNVEVSEQRHKDAQDTIVRAGNNLEVLVQRGGLATWKPHVSPVGSIPSPNPYQSISPTPATKTSPVAPNCQSPLSRPPCGFSSPSKPFAHSQVISCQENGTSKIKAIVNKQHNSPVGIYSDESIAETLSAQAEVLAGGVLGVNFKKNEKSYNAEASEVFKMLREAEKEPQSPEPSDNTTQNGVATPIVAGPRHVSAPQIKPPTSESSLTPGKNICADCERLIVGVFVRIKDKNLHVECFKCATCGTSLKNVGYYSINNKLYCDIHAKMIAKQNPPAPNLEPVTVSPSQFGTSKPYSPVPMHNINTAFPSQTPCRTPSSFHNTSNLNGTNNAVTSSHFKNVSASKSGGPGGGVSGGKSAGLSAPRRGKGVWNPQNNAPGARIPLCAHCNSQIRGPFITALGKIWCPEHFLCVNQKCRRSLLDVGFVEEPTGLYCEYCFEQYLAPTCSKCSAKVKGDCLNAIGKQYHPECFTCAYCGTLFGNNPFFLEDGLPYCENDWNELFTTKCFACGFPIEAGDRWVEALNNNYHSPCFNCTMCKTNLEGQSFYAKGGRPFCKSHCR